MIRFLVFPIAICESKSWTINASCCRKVRSYIIAKCWEYHWKNEFLHYSATKYWTLRIPPTNNTTTDTKDAGPCLIKGWHGKTYHLGKSPLYHITDILWRNHDVLQPTTTIEKILYHDVINYLKFYFCHQFVTNLCPLNFSLKWRNK